MECERLSSMVLEFQAHHEALVPTATGRLLHARFLNLIAQFDEGCSKQLHDEPHYRPFPVSPLQCTQILEEYALLRRGHTYTCRVTLFDGGDLQQQLQTYVRQTQTIPVHLDNAVLSLKRVISPPAIEYLEAAHISLCPACSRRDARRAAALTERPEYKDLTIEEILTMCGLCDAHGFLVTAKRANMSGRFVS